MKNKENPIKKKPVIIAGIFAGAAAVAGVVGTIIHKVHKKQ